MRNLTQVIYPVLILLTCLFFGCINQQSEKQGAKYQKKILSENNTLVPSETQFDSIKTLGQLKNIDYLNGYKSLKLGMSIDSNDFGNNAQINNIYQRRDIIKIEIPSIYIDIFQKEADISLTFLNKGLSLIEISKIQHFKVDPSGARGHEIISKLEKMFGNPNIKDHFSDGISDDTNSDNDPKSTLFEINTSIWQTDRIRVSFDCITHYYMGEYYWIPSDLDNQKGIPGKTTIEKFPTQQSYSLRYELINNHDRIQMMINEIDDSLKTQDKESDKTKFIKQF